MEKNLNIEKLIEEVQERRAIWDMRHEDYADKLKRKHSWEEIVSSFVEEDATIEEKKEMGNLLQKKWKNMRDRYRRDASKEKGKSGQAAKRTAPYMYRQQMRFLKDIINSRTTSNSLDDNNEPEAEENVVEEHANLTKELNNPRWTEIGKKRKLPSVEAKLMETLENNTMHREKREKMEEDDDRLFLLSLLPQLKLIHPHNKFNLRVDIMQAINKYVAPPPMPTPVSNLLMQYNPALIHQQYPYRHNIHPQSSKQHEQPQLIHKEPREHHTVHQSTTPLQSPTNSIQSDITQFSPEGSESRYPFLAMNEFRILATCAVYAPRADLPHDSCMQHIRWPTRHFESAKNTSCVCIPIRSKKQTFCLEYIYVVLVL